MTSPEMLQKLLDDHELDIFTEQSFARETKQHLQRWMPQLRTLIKNGLTDIIEKGKYCRHNFRNEYTISNYLAEDGVVAYWSALNLHGLTEQFPNTIFVQTARQKKNKTVFGVAYQFIKVKPQKLTGIEWQGHGNNRFRITGKEKTIADCFDLPQYSGGYEELIRAYANTPLDAAKLVAYCQAINNIAATKRMGYLAELFKKASLQPFVEYALGAVNEKYSPFDPLAPNEGKHNKKWRLRLNIPEADILKIPNKMY